MGYDRGDSFLFDFEPIEIPFDSKSKGMLSPRSPKGIPFGLKSKGKLSPRSYPIQFDRKWNTSFLSVRHKRPYAQVA